MLAPQAGPRLLDPWSLQEWGGRPGEGPRPSAPLPCLPASPPPPPSPVSFDSGCRHLLRAETGSLICCSIFPLVLQYSVLC